MYIRKKKNKSGTVSIQIIDKSKGKYTVVRTIGKAKDLNEIERLFVKAKHLLCNNENIQTPLFKTILPADAIVENFLDTLVSTHIHTIGPELIFGTIFDRIGYNIIPESMFRHLVIARLVYPTSKLKTVDYLERYQNIFTNSDIIYRFLDKLHKSYKNIVEKISYEHTKKTLGIISVVFYDMTTLYFEAEDEDDLRKIGFSKDGKFQCPQIMIGLLVSEGGYPIGYDIFEGNTYEGKTLVPILQNFRKKYGFNKPIVVADAAMLSGATMKELIKEKYTFIIGARIKNENNLIKKEILEKSIDIKDGQVFEILKENTRLIVSYSDKRARKDAHNRDKGLKKLREKVKSGVLTKTSITNRGYNKFLSISKDVSVEIDEAKIKDDQKWDGLKGYVTTSKLSVDEIIKNYSHLWQIEKAFRISKTDLRIRPIHHYRKRRIEAHLCITFVAYSIWKEVERLLKENKINMSGTRAAELTQTMYEIEYELPESKLVKKHLVKLSSEQQLLYEVIHRK